MKQIFTFLIGLIAVSATQPSLLAQTGCPNDPTVIVRTYEVTDLSGNTSTCEHRITVIDDTPPELYCPSNLTANCTITEVPAYVNYAAFEAAGGSSNDNCGIDEPTFMLLSENSDGASCPETVTRVYQIADQCGNTSTCAQIIVINNQTSPSIVCPNDYFVNCFADISVNINDATFISTCPAGQTTAVAGPTLIGGKNECPGALYEIEYSVTDNCGVTERCSQFVSINPNMMTLTCPADQTLACGADLPAPNPNSVTVNMNLCPNENPPTVTFVSDASDSGTGCNGDPEQVFRTYQVTDACGNTAFCIQTFTYNTDTAAPTIAACPNNQTITPTPTLCYGVVPDMTGSLTATDDCTATADLTVTQNPVAGALFGFVEGDTQIVTFTVTDACGQQTTCSAILTYNAVDVPTITSATPTDETDCDAADGTITVVANGADEYSIDGGISWQAMGSFVGLSAGTYVVVVRNVDGTCEAQSTTQEVVISAPNAPSITQVDVTPTACGGNSGSITITATSGIAPLQYSIDGGANYQTSNVFAGLAGGLYPIQVTNADGTCLVVYSSVLIEEQVEPIITSVETTSITNCGLTDGTISIIANSPAGNALLYSIDGGTYQSSNIFTGLAAGSYPISVTNGDGSCEVTNANVIITEPTAPIIASVTTSNPSDCGAADGTVTINATGVSGTLEYSIDGGATWQATNSFSSLTAGDYNIVVRYDDGTCEVVQAAATVLDDDCGPIDDCPDINAIHAAQEDVCSDESVNFVVNVDESLNGETLDYVIVNPGAAIDPYTQTATGSGVVAGNLFNFNDAMPTNTTCEMNSVQIYVYLNAATISNLGLSADCRPFVATTVNIWPDLSNVTITTTVENCVATFTPNCNGSSAGITVTPSTYVIAEGQDPTVGTPTLSISSGVGSDCPDITYTTVDLPLCNPECPDIADVQLDAESVCEATGTNITVTVEPNLVGVPLTIAYGNPNEGVITTVYSTAPSTILINTFTVSATTGVGSFTIPTMPANTGCSPDNYVFYVYVSDPSTAGTNGSSLGTSCQPLAYTNVLVWPNPNDMVVTATTSGCTTFFDVADCPGYEVTPEFYTAAEGDAATTENISIIPPANSPCPTSTTTAMAIPECIPTCPEINDIQLDNETICEGTATTLSITTSGHFLMGELLTVAYGNANEALIADVYNNTPNTVISSGVVATTGTTSVSTGAFPANATCDPVNYIVYAYLTNPNTAGPNNSALPTNCRPVAWTNITVWPNPADMTPTLILTEDCVSFFGVLECPEYEVNPAIYAANEGDAVTNVAVQVLADPASPCSDATATNLAVPACASDCPDITTIQLDATSYCEGDNTDIVVTTDASLVGNNLTIAFGNVNEPAVPFVYAAPPANIITTTALVTNVGGIGSVLIPANAIPANTTCNTQTYFFYAYITDLTTAGPSNSALPADCQPVIYTQITVFPDPADFTPTVLSTEDCISYFGILECPEFEVSPEFFIASNGDPATTTTVSVLADASSPCADSPVVPVAIPACDPACPEIYDIQLDAESICEVSGVDITIVTEDLLVGEDLTIAYGNADQSVIFDPYSMPPSNIITSTATVSTAAGNGIVSIPSGNFPANNSCSPETYIIYVYVSDLTTAGPGNSALPADCKPIAYSSVTVWPDPAEMTAGISFTKDCLTIFEVLDCPGYQPSPKFYISLDGSDATDVSVQILADPASPCADADAIDYMVPACVADCPDITDIQLDDEIICEAENTQITVTLDTELVGETLTFAYGTANEGVLNDIYTTPPANIISTTVLITDNSGTGIATFPTGTLPANNTCEPATYIVYAYLTDPDTAGPLDSALPIDCRPVIYASLTIYPDLTDVTITTTVENCIATFSPLCPNGTSSGVTVTPSSYVIAEGTDPGAGIPTLTISGGVSSPCADVSITNIDLPLCDPDCPDITDIQLDNEIICEGENTNITVSVDGEFIGENLTFAFGNANEAVLGDVYTTPPANIVSNAVTVANNGGTGIATIASGTLPANNSCQPENYIVYAYLTDPSTAGANNSALVTTCRPVVYASVTIYPDLTDVTIITTVENCIATFTPVCPDGSTNGVTITPSSFVIAEGTDPVAGMPTLTISGGVSSPCDDVTITTIDLPLCDPDCPDITDIQLDNEIICEGENTNITVSVDGEYIGKDLTVAYGNANEGVLTDVYTTPPANIISSAVTVANNGGTGIATIASGTLPANNSCQPENYIVYAYLTNPSTAGVNNSALVTTCRPVVYALVTIYPDLTDVTIITTVENCIATFTPVCPDGSTNGVTVTPSSFVITEGTDPAVGTPSLNISGGVSSPCDDVTITTIDLPLCDPDCPDITDIQLDDEIVCESEGTIITVSTDGEFIGEDLTFAYGMANQGVLGDVYNTPPANIISSTVTVTNNSGTGIATIASGTLPANNSCQPETYIVYAYLTNPSTAGANNTALVATCRPVVYASVTIYPDLTDVTITTTVENCIATFVPVCPDGSSNGVTVTPSSFVIPEATDPAAGTPVLTISGGISSPCDDVTISIIDLPYCDSECNIFISVETSDPSECNTNNGIITINASGGLAPYNYSIDGGVNFQASNQFTGLSGDSYDIVVQSADLACEVVYPNVILTDKESPIILSVASTNVTDCNTNDGTITITAAGSGSLEFSINGGTTWQSGDMFENLTAGTYEISVQNADGTCQVNDVNVVITEPIAPFISDVLTANPSDCSVNDGSVTVNILAGTGSGSFEYSIDGGFSWQAANMFTNLSSGTYNVIVRNDDGTCEVAYQPIFLTIPDAPIITNVAFTDPTECNVNNGTITITAIAGSGNYEYSIDGGLTWTNTSGVFTSLAGGTYPVFVRNLDDTCETQGQIIVLTDKVFPTIINVENTNLTDCNENNGTITITADGVGSLEFSINDGATWQSSDYFDNLPAGLYEVVVRNVDESCEVDAPNVIITEPIAPIINNISVNNPSDCGESDGQISIVTTFNPLLGVEYSIDGGLTWQTGNTFTNLPAGSYNITIRNGDETCTVLNGEATILDDNCGPIDDCPDINSILAMQPDICSDGNVNFIINTDEPLNGEFLNYVLVNPAANIDPYTQPPTGTSQVNNQTTSFDIDMPTNTTCDILVVEVYAYLTATTITNLNLDPDCTPFVATTINIWPDITQMTPQISASNGCAIALNSSCEDYLTTPSIVIQESGETGNPLQQITINAPAGSPCSTFTTTIDLSSQFCEPGCEIFCPGSVDRCVDANDCIWTADVSVNPIITDCNDVTLTYTVIEPNGNTNTGTASLENYEFELGSSAVYWTVTDNNNPTITSQCAFTVTITDCEAPVITTCPNDTVDVVCGDSRLNAWLATFTATDNCDTDLAMNYVLIAQNDSCGSTFSATYQFTATDDAGNATSCTATYENLDNVVPEIIVPDDLIIECGDDVSIMVLPWLEQFFAGDDCGRISRVTNTFDNTLLQNINYCSNDTISVQFTVFDECGNTNSDNANIIIVADTIAPIFTNCPADMVVGVDVNACTANVVFSQPIAEDCSSGTQGNVVVTQIQGIAPGMIFPFGDTLIEYEAVDACGNRDTCSFTVTVIDTDVPKISCPSNNVVVCADAGFCSWVSDTQVSPVSFVENCPDFIVAYEITGATETTGAGSAAGAVFNLGTNVITYLIQDNNQNEISSCTFTVIVEDCAAPLLTCSDLTVACDSEDITTWAADIAATAQDPSSCNNVTVNYSLYNDISSCGNTINQVYEFIATDDAGNSTTCYATYTTVDTIKPNLSVPTNLQLACGDDMVAEALDWLEAYSANDACGAVEINNNFDFNSLSTACTGSTIPVTFTALDVCGNDSMAIANIIIAADTTAPTFINCPANITVNADADICVANVIYSTPIIEDCNSASVILTTGIPSGQAFPLGVTPIVFTASDVCGNESTCEFTITVIDSQNPEIVCPSSINVCNDDNTCFWTATTAADPTFADCTNTNLNYVITNPDGTVFTGTGLISDELYQFQIGASSVTYFINDGTNNTSCNFTVAVQNCTDGYFDLPSVWCQSDSIYDFVVGTNLFVSPSTATITITSNPIGFVTDSGTNWQFNPAGGILNNPSAGTSDVTITLTVDNGATCTQSYTQQVVVNQSGNAEFVLPATVCEANGIVALDLDSTIDIGAGAEFMIPEYVTWSGPAVTENGDGISATFNPTTYSEGTYEICATVGSPSCEKTVCQTINVGDATESLIYDLTQCADPSGLFSLSDLVATTATQGGVFSITNFIQGGTVTVMGNNLTYNYSTTLYPIVLEVQYGFDTNNDGDFNDFCESVDTARITIVEQPNPSFDLPSSFCELDPFGNNITYDLTAYLTSETYSPTSIYNYGWEIVSGAATVSVDGTVFDPMGAGLVTIQLTDTLSENNLNCIAQWQEVIEIEVFPCEGKCGESEDIDIQDNVICASDILVLNLNNDGDVIYPDFDGNGFGDYYFDVETSNTFNPYIDVPSNRITWGDNVTDGTNLGTYFYGDNSLVGLSGLGIMSNTVYYLYGSVWEDDGSLPILECQDITTATPFVVLDPVTLTATSCACNNNETDQFNGTHDITISPNGGAPVAYDSIGGVMAASLGIGANYTWTGIGTIPSSGTADNGIDFDITVFDGQTWAVTITDNQGCEHTVSGNCTMPQPDLIGLMNNCTSDPIYTIYDDRTFDTDFESNLTISQTPTTIGINAWPGNPAFNLEGYHYQIGPFDGLNTPLLNGEFELSLDFSNVVSVCPIINPQYAVSIFVNGNSYFDFFEIPFPLQVGVPYIFDESSVQFFGTSLDPITSSDIIDIYITSASTTCDAGDNTGGWTADIDVNFEAAFSNFPNVTYTINELDTNGDTLPAPAGLLIYNGDGSATINPGNAGNGGQFLITYCELDNPSTGCEICQEEIINIYPTLNPAFNVVPSICTNAPIVPLVPVDFANYVFPDVFVAQPTGNNLDDYTGWSGPGVTDNGNGTGYFDPSDLIPGVYTINFFAGYDDCKEYYSQSIEVYDIPNATIKDFKVCEADGTFNLTQLFTSGVTTTGGYFYTSEGTVNGNILVLDSLGCAGLNALPLTVTYVVGNASLGCEGIDTAELTICPDVDASFTIPPAVCVDPLNVNITVTLTPDNIPPSCTPDSTATWTVEHLNVFTGITTQINAITDLNNFNAEFDALTASAGLSLPATFFITFELGNGDCRESYTQTITVVNQLVADLGDDLSICYDAMGIDLTGFFGFETTPGGTWSLASTSFTGAITAPYGVFGDTFLPPFSVTGECYTIEYMVEDPRGLCNSNVDDIEICITPTPGTMIDLPSGFCAVTNQGENEVANTINLANYITSNANNTIQIDSVTWEVISPSIFADTIYAGLPSSNIFLDVSEMFGLITIRYTETSSFNGTDCTVSHEEVMEIYPNVNPTFICPQTICIDEFDDLNQLVLYPENPLTNLGYEFAESDTLGCPDAFFKYLDDNVVWSISATNVNGVPFTTNALTNIYDCTDALNNQSAIFSLPEQAGNYTITLTMGKGECTETFSCNIQVLSNQLADLFTMNTDTICIANGPVDMNLYLPNGFANSGTFSGNGIAGNLFYPEIAGVFSHTICYESIMDFGTCDGTQDCMTLFVEQDVDASWIPQSFWCEGDTIVLIPNNLDPNGYFSANDLYINNLIQPHPVLNGAAIIYPSNLANYSPFEVTYTVISNFGSCQASETHIINIGDDISAELMTDMTLCYTEDIDLTAFFTNNTTPGGTFSGPNLEGNELIPAINGGTYTITYTIGDVTSACGEVSDEITIIIIPAPNADFDLPGAFCELTFGDFYFLPDYLLPDADANGTWSIIEGGGILNAGNYTPNGYVGLVTIRYTVGDGICTIYHDEVVLVGNEIDPTFEMPLQICVGESYYLDGFAAVTGFPFSGVDVNNGIFVPTTEGTYTITHTVGEGLCLDEFTLSVVVEDGSNSLMVINSYKACVNNLTEIVVSGDYDNTFNLYNEAGNLLITGSNYLQDIFDVSPFVTTAGDYIFLVESVSETGCGSTTFPVNYTVCEQPIIDDVIITCTDVTTGLANVTVLGIGGKPGYCISADGGETFTEPTVFDINLPVGIQQLIIKDFYGCYSEPFQVVINEPLDVNIYHSCIDTNGFAQIVAEPTGGTGTYSMYLNDVLVESLTETVTGGTYIVTIVDSNGCTLDAVTVNISEQITFETTVSCPDVDGLVEVEVMYVGTQDYTISVDGMTFMNPFLINPNDFDGIVVDVILDGCLADAIYLELPDKVTAGILDIGCYNNNTDFTYVELFANGGTGNYQISINGEAYQPFGDGASYFQSGTYTFDIIDSNGCSTETITVDLGLENQLVPSLDENSVYVACHDYDIVLIGNGATGNQTYEWYNANLELEYEGIVFQPTLAGDSIYSFFFTIRGTDGCDGGLIPFNIVVDSNYCTDEPGVDTCDNPPVCKGGTICVQPMTPTTLCPDDCISNGFTITETNSLYNCSVVEMPNGCVIYTPLPGMEILGSDFVIVTYTDGVNCVNVEFDIIVSEDCTPNTPPVAEDDFETSGDEGVAIYPLGNDSDPDNDPISICNVETPLNGMVTIQGNMLYYTPNEGFYGYDSFEYTICDGNGGESTATVIIYVPEPCENTNLEYCIGHMGVEIICPEFCDDSFEVNSVVSLYSCSLWEMPNGCIRYTALPGFYGIDVVVITGTNANGEESEITIEFTVSDNCDGNNIPPVAQPDTTETYVNIPISINVLVNDSDADNNSLTVCGFTNPANGTITESNGVFSFVPNTDFEGTTSFEYTICDGFGGEATTMVTINVMPYDCQNSDLNYCTQPMQQIVICPEFCHFDENFTIYSIYEIFEVESLYGCSYEIISPTCITYRPLPGLTGTDVITILAINDTGQISAVEVYIDIDENCEGNTRFGNSSITQLDCELSTPNIMLTDNSFAKFDNTNCFNGENYTLEVFNVNGQLVNTFNGVFSNNEINQVLQQGLQGISGMYIYRLTTEGDNAQTAIGNIIVAK